MHRSSVALPPALSIYRPPSPAAPEPACTFATLAPWRGASRCGMLAEHIGPFRRWLAANAGGLL